MFQTCHSFFNIFACSRHCHEDWYWLSRTLHSRRFFMSRSLFEKNQKIILIKLAWTSPTRRASPASLIHPLWLQGTILFEELWQKKEKKVWCCRSFELCTRSAMRLKKRGASFEFFNAAMGKLDGKKHLSCAHLFHKRLLKMRVVGKTAATATKKIRFCKADSKGRRHHPTSAIWRAI